MLVRTRLGFGAAAAPAGRLTAIAADGFLTGRGSIALTLVEQTDVKGFEAGATRKGV